MNSSKRLNRRLKITFVGLKDSIKKVIPLLIFLPVLVLSLSLLKIKKINCLLNNNPCPQQVIVFFDKLVGTNSLFVNQKELLTLLKANYPVDKMKLSFRAFNTLNLELEGKSPYIQVNAYLVSSLPTFSMDQAPSTTDSAGWWVKPTGEVRDYLLEKTAQSFNLWENGIMTSEATSSTNISYIFTKKPGPQAITSINQIVKLVSKYLEVSEIFIIEDRCFLSINGQPDIILSVPSDEAYLSEALQSMSYLVTIKKDAKVIDLSYKNPIIR